VEERLGTKEVRKGERRSSSGDGEEGGERARATSAMNEGGTGSGGDGLAEEDGVGEGERTSRASQRDCNTRVEPRVDMIVGK
jgi:hypothetical protein